MRSTFDIDDPWGAGNMDWWVAELKFDLNHFFFSLGGEVVSISTQNRFYEDIQTSGL